MTVYIGLTLDRVVQNLLTSVKLCGSYGLYKVTMDLEVCYEFKSGFADDDLTHIELP